MISVIITSKNGSAYIEKAIDSVLLQTCTHVELIVVSDGSTDDTAEVVRKKALTSPLVPIRVIELKKNIGPGLARNLAILGGSHPDGTDELIPACEGEYIALIDDDDVWINPLKLETQKAFLDIHKDTVLVGSSRVAFKDESGRLIKYFVGEKDSKSIRKHMLSKNPIITSSAFFRKDAFIKIGGFKHMYLAEDYDLWLRLGTIGHIANVDNAEVEYLVRKKSASNTRTLDLFKTTLRLVIQYRKQYPGFVPGFVKGVIRIVLFYIKNLF